MTASGGRTRAWAVVCRASAERVQVKAKDLLLAAETASVTAPVYRIRYRSGLTSALRAFEGSTATNTYTDAELRALAAAGTKVLELDGDPVEEGRRETLLVSCREVKP